MGVCPAAYLCNRNAMLKTAATKTRSCLIRERTARTQGAAAASQAHFAAVMGNAIDSVLQESEDYRVYDSLTSDRDLQSALDQVRRVVPVRMFHLACMCA